MYIKKFESFNESIEDICDKYNVLDRLNAFLDDIGKSPVDSVRLYKNI